VPLVYIVLQVPLVYIVLHQVPFVYIVLHHHFLCTTLTVAPPSTSTHGLLECLIHLDTGRQDKTTREDNKGTEAQFAQVNEAYHTLSDVQKRAAYDTLVAKETAKRERAGRGRHSSWLESHLELVRSRRDTERESAKEGKSVEEGKSDEHEWAADLSRELHKYGAKRGATGRGL